MVLTTIFAVRHGFRPAFNTDPYTGEIKSSYNSPTGIGTDPPLTSYGVKQAEELSVLADTLTPRVSRIYTSPFYRCIQTIAPFAARLPDVPLIMDQGLGDWYGRAKFLYPSPADLQTLRKWFPTLVEKTSFIVSRNGEGLEEIHDRIAFVMARIIADADATCISSEPESIVISTHAAVLICLGRALTGRVPENRDEHDFDTYTCSVSTYERQETNYVTPPEWKSEGALPVFGWRGIGVGGQWNCTVNASVDHLANGGERNWHFSGDESFVDAMQTADPDSMEPNIESKKDENGQSSKL